MASPARDLIVNLVGRTNQLMGPLEGASARMQQVGGTLTRTLTPAAAALGAGMALAGREYNTGVDAIRTGTGATGAELDAMTNTMRSLSGDSTIAGIGLAGVGQILADVSTRTGATGADLEELTTRFAQLDRMGIPASVESVSRAFGDWGIETEHQADVMDALFLASQSSGASVDTLSEKVVQFGAPLRNLGFGFEEATALLAAFEVNGVNTETVMAGLKIGIGTLAKAGEDVPDTFRRVVSEIENTEDASEATRLAIELFGQRAGPDLADAIQNGQFAVEDMLEAIQNGDDTIADAAEDTTHLSDKFAALKNRLVGALGPFGELGGVLGGTLASVGPLLMGLGSLGPAFMAVKSAVLAMNTALLANPFVLITAALIAIGVLIFFHRDKVLGALVAAWEWVKKTTEKVWNAIKDFFVKWWPLLLVIVTGGAAAIPLLIIKYWDDIVRITSNLITDVVDFFKKLPGRIKDGVESAISTVLTWFGELGGRVLSAIGDALTTLFNVGWDLISGLGHGLLERFLGLVIWVKGLPGRILTAIGNGLLVLKDIGKDILQGLWNGLKEKWTDIAGWFGDRVQDVKNFFTSGFGILSPSRVFKEYGQNMMKGLEIGLGSGSRGTDRTMDRIMGGLMPSGGGSFRGGGNTPIRVQVVMPDGRVLAEAVAEANIQSGGQFS